MSQNARHPELLCMLIIWALNNHDLQRLTIKVCHCLKATEELLSEQPGPMQCEINGHKELCSESNSSVALRQWQTLMVRR
jgi:hypothetical protein